ncbi:hypothetical protein LXL04_014781 [Taraxacum kok-saghyz]
MVEGDGSKNSNKSNNKKEVQGKHSENRWHILLYGSELITCLGLLTKVKAALRLLGDKLHPMSVLVLNIRMLKSFVYVVCCKTRPTRPRTRNRPFTEASWKKSAKILGFGQTRSKLGTTRTTREIFIILAVQMRTIIGFENGGTNLGHLFHFAADQFSVAGALPPVQHI